MNRIVEPELLDELPPDDPRAARSRRDLRRVNAWMRNHEIMAGALRNRLNGRALECITDLGAGDGYFLLRVAQKISSRWPDVHVTLLDRRQIVSDEVLAALANPGWRAEVVVADAFDWVRNGNFSQIVVANLFLHHFENERLADLLRAVAQRAELFVAVEPRRAGWPLFCCRWLWAIGCDAVTRHDARISVRAGFTGQELSALWPDGQSWRLTEHSAGPFSHLFVAQRIS
jgi:Methyltransferase domain